VEVGGDEWEGDCVKALSRAVRSKGCESTMTGTSIWLTPSRPTRRNQQREAGST
jgi:hypothetical protein